MIEVNGAEWTESVVLYTVVILPPASRKSPVFKIMMRPVRQWEREEVKKAVPRRLAAQDGVDVWGRELK